MHAVTLLHQNTDGIFGSAPASAAVGCSTVTTVSVVAVLLNCTLLCQSS